MFTFDDWARGAERVKHGVAPFKVLIRGGGELLLPVDILMPRATTVVGHDWIPILPDGRATIDRMVHTPEVYLPKMRNVIASGSEFALAVRRSSIEVRSALLVGGSRNYYHWMLDHLPRLLWAKSLGMAQGRTLIMNDQLAPFQRETLDIVGLGAHPRREVADDEAVACSSLLVPSLLARASIVHPLALKLLRDAFPRISKGPGQRRLYISRGDAQVRRVLNEDEVIRRLSGHGFEAVTLSALSFGEQHRLFSEASIVLGPHGAGFTNMLFCHRGATVMEIHSPSLSSSFFRLLSQLLGHRYTSLPVATAPATYEGPPTGADWLVDVDALEAALVPGIAADR